ncbi:MAG TPA: MlaD family protein [Candidatus Limnocylindria bacterium]|nr:MlaD family protein [Candidatus Limnocylindria bacterium]
MEKASYFKIGLFIIVGTVLGAIGVVALGVGTIFQKKVMVETYIDESVQGLDVGSSVKFRGVQVGKVETISLTSAEYPTKRRYVLVRIGLTTKIFLADAGSPSFLAEVEKGLRVRLASQGVTGAAYIEADYQDPARNPPLEIDWQPRYPYVPSSRSRITQLSESVEKILRSVEDIDVGRLVDGLEKSLLTITKVAEGANFDKLGGQANAFLTEVRETNRQLKELIGNSDIKSAFKDSAAAASGARQIIERAQAPVNQMLADLPRAAESLERMVKRLDAVTADLPETSAQLRQTLQRMNRLIATQQQGIAATVENLQAVSSDIKELTESSRKYPSQVLFGAPPPPSKVMQR